MWIYSAYITKNGKRIYAKTYGKKAFYFWVDDAQDERTSSKDSDESELERSTAC